MKTDILMPERKGTFGWEFRSMITGLGIFGQTTPGKIPQVIAASDICIHPADPSEKTMKHIVPSEHERLYGDTITK